jgi:hypothetical protein
MGLQTCPGRDLKRAFASNCALGNDGFSRIVAPGDKEDGRFVCTIANIVVRTINSFPW